MAKPDQQSMQKRSRSRIPEHALVRFAGALGALLILLVVVLVVVDVFSRRYSETPLRGMTGLAQMATVIAVYLGMGEALRTEQHVSVGLVVVRLPEAVARFVAVIRAIIILAMGTYFTYASYLSAQSSYRRQEVIAGAVDLIIWPGRAAVVVGSALFTLAMFERVLRRDLRTIHEKRGLGAQ